MTELPGPIPSYLPKETVHAIAEKAALDLGYLPGRPLEPIVKEIGGRISYHDFEGLVEADSGSLLVNGEADFEVRLSSSTSGVRDRFTIAHELGHYVLHYLYARQNGHEHLDRMSAKRFGSDRAEWEANWFAAAFLMPRAAFEAAYRQHDGKISPLAGAFEVSYKAAEVRAVGLGLKST